MVRRSIVDEAIQPQVNRLAGLTDELRETVSGIRTGREKLAALHERMEKEHLELFHSVEEEWRGLAEDGRSQLKTQREAWQELIDGCKKDSERWIREGQERIEDWSRQGAEFQRRLETRWKEFEAVWDKLRAEQEARLAKAEELLSQLASRVARGEATQLRMQQELEQSTHERRRLERDVELGQAERASLRARQEQQHAEQGQVTRQLRIWSLSLTLGFALLAVLLFVV